MATSTVRTLERTTLRKVYLRLVPYCFLLYILCYIDRINVSFAALTMNKDIGLSAYIYGLAAGAFFWGYCLLEVPSNLILEKIGARIWITRIMVSWGLLSAATAFVVGPWSFFTVRVLLGIAEAGLFPGILLYFHRWFPQHHLARVVAGFLIGIPLSAAIGAPLSTAFMQLDGIAGLHGWQWVFLGEGVPTALIGVSVWFLLTERPSEAKWLTPEERAWLTTELGQERRRIEAVRTHSILSSMINPRVWVLTILFGGITMSAIGVVLFMPQILKGLGVSNTQAGLLTAIPYAIATIVMVACAFISDRTGDRYWTLTISCACGALGLVLAAIMHNSLFGVLAAFSLATAGFYGMKAVFWATPSAFLTGPALAAGLAFINSIGNFCGYLGPIVVGYAKDRTGSFEAGIYVLAATAAISAVTALGCALWMPRTAARVAVPAVAPVH